MNERVAIGGGAAPREAGMIGPAARTWREHPELRTAGLHDRLLRLWTEAEAARLAGIRLRQQLAAGQPGPEGSAAKLVFARLNQEITEFEVELAGAEGLRYDDWSLRRPEVTNFFGRDSGYRFLRAKGNSIEGGTSEILRNIIAERVLGLPAEIRVDKDVAMEGPAAMSQATQTPASQAPATPGPQAAAPNLLYGRTRPSCATPCARCWPTGPPGATCWPGPRPARPTTPGCGRRWPRRSAAPAC